MMGFGWGWYGEARLRGVLWSVGDYIHYRRRRYGALVLFSFSFFLFLFFLVGVLLSHRYRSESISRYVFSCIYVRIREAPRPIAR